MNKGILFLIILLLVGSRIFAQSTLLGTYYLNETYYITFYDDYFVLIWDNVEYRNNYTVSGNIVTLNFSTPWNWTISNENTIIDHRNYGWNKLVESGLLNVNSAADWIDVVNLIRNGSNYKIYIINVTGDLSVLPTDGNTFSSIEHIVVILQGNGTLTPSRNGALLQIRTSQTVVLKDLTLQGRNDNNSSLVIINRGTLRMEGNAIITGNNGNGVEVSGGTFTMRDSASVTYNTGRGVYTSGTFTMRDNTSVNGNTGGGVHVHQGTFTMQGNASVSNNTTSGNGGGVSVFAGQEFVAFTFISGRFIMQGGTISENTANNGGGVYIGGTRNGGTFTMQGGTISGNTARRNGGGVCSTGSFTMQGEASILFNKSNQNGGGVYTSNSTFTMQDGIIAYNTAMNGGGVYIDSYRRFNLQGGFLLGNTAIENGGGVYATTGNETFFKYGGTIYGNNETNLSQRNVARQGVVVYWSASSGAQWRNSTAGPSINTDTFGFWLND